jgi:nucleoside-diphosphate-sugar epimerase
MEIFVTGASGYIGRHVVPVLRAAGLDVAALARSDEAESKARAMGATPVRGDLANPSGWVRRASQSAAVVHIGMDWKADMAAVENSVTDALIDVLAGTDKPLIYTSGVWVMGSTGDRLGGEMWPLKPPPLVAWRPAVERKVQDARERKVCGVVIRPAMVFGNGGGRDERMIAQGRAEGVIRVPGDGSNRWSFVHVEDLADLYLLALERASAGELYIAADGPAVKVSDLASACAHAAGGARLEYLAPDAARSAFSPVADCLLLDQRIGSTKAGRQLGWKPSRPTILKSITGANHSAAGQASACGGLQSAPQE